MAILKRQDLRRRPVRHTAQVEQSDHSKSPVFNYTGKITVFASGQVLLDTPQGRRSVGNLTALTDGRLVFHTKRCKSKHLFRATTAWGIDEALLAFLCKRNVAHVIVEEQEENILYISDPQSIAEKGHTFDLGHGRQRFLPLTFWMTMSNN